MKGFVESLQKKLSEVESQNREREEEVKRDREEYTLTEFVKEFGMEPDKVENNEVTIDGVILRHNGYSKGWSLLSECPACREKVFSTGEWEITIAKMLSGKEKIQLENHNCAGKKKEDPPSTEQQLINLLKQLIYEETPYNGQKRTNTKLLRARSV